jgi:hypothetical protein
MGGDKFKDASTVAPTSPSHERENELGYDNGGDETDDGGFEDDIIPRQRASEAAQSSVVPPAVVIEDEEFGGGAAIVISSATGRGDRRVAKVKPAPCSTRCSSSSETPKADAFCGKHAIESCLRNPRSRGIRNTSVPQRLVLWRASLARKKTP